MPPPYQTRRYSPSEQALLETRARAAIANNPAIAPRHLAEQTGMQLGHAIAWLEENRGK